MDLPVLLAVDDDADLLAAVERELIERYGRHYEVVCVTAPADALVRLEECAASGVEVALVLASQWMRDMTGLELLGQVRRSHPQAGRRALLVDWGDWGQGPTGEAIFDGIAHSQLDNYVLRPLGPPDEEFDQAIATLLSEWAESHPAMAHVTHIVGDAWEGRAYELRATLQACALPHNFCLADSDKGRQLVAAAGVGTALPIMVFPNGHVLVDPTNAQIATAAGGAVSPSQQEYDLVIVGAGPAGLSAAVYGASEGLSTLVVDRGGIGGQATSSSLIRNYLGFPSGISGRHLARQAYDQAWIFGAKFAFMQPVTTIERDDERLVVTLAESGPVRASAVLLAMGARYRRIDVPALEALTGAGVFYGGPTSEAPALVGKEVFVVGGANSAGQAALHLARYARRVTVVVRGSSLRAGMSEYLVSQIEATENIEVRLGTTVIDGGGAGRLEQLVLCDVATREQTVVEAQALFLLIGAQPYTDWLPPEIARDPQGFVLTGSEVSSLAWPLGRRPFDLETSLPGVLAAGDVRHGSVKRVASAVGEGSIAVQLVHQLLTAEGIEPRGLRSAEAPSAFG